jgi:hypothetical protein
LNADRSRNVRYDSGTGLDYVLSDKETSYDKSGLDQLTKDNRGKIVNYFMNVKEKIKLEELSFY